LFTGQQKKLAAKQRQKQKGGNLCRLGEPGKGDLRIYGQLTCPMGAHSTTLKSGKRRAKNPETSEWNHSPIIKKTEK